MRSDLLFHVAVLGGLLLLVRVMIAGVEAPGATPLTAGQKLRVRLGPALIGVFLLITGSVGSIALPLGLPFKATIATALLSGVVVATLAKNLIVTAASLPVTDHEFDPRYALQGVPGVVIEPIPSAGQGAVELRGYRGVVVARYAAESVDGAPLPAGVEIAVERVEGEVAYVEAWSAVERRL